MKNWLKTHLIGRSGRTVSIVPFKSSFVEPWASIVRFFKLELYQLVYPCSLLFCNLQMRDERLQETRSNLLSFSISRDKQFAPAKGNLRLYKILSENKTPKPILKEHSHRERLGESLNTAQSREVSEFIIRPSKAAPLSSPGNSTPPQPKILKPCNISNPPCIAQIPIKGKTKSTTPHRSVTQIYQIKATSWGSTAEPKS